MQRRFDDLVPVGVLREGFQFRRHRVSFGSFYSGIFRPKEMSGPAALSLVTAAPKLAAQRPMKMSSTRRPGGSPIASVIHREAQQPLYARRRPTIER